MEGCRNSDTNTNSLGFCLLPSELIQSILLSLALPEIIRMKLVNKFLAYLISDRDFIRRCNLRSRSATWLFVYKKRWRRDATIHGFSDQSNRWFKVCIDDLMKQVVFYPGEDVYLLTASGNIFLFASNNQKVVIAVNLVSKMVKKIPPCPLGTRGTSSWRRSGMKLVLEPSGSGHFRFLFVELVETTPVVFEYNSETQKWHRKEARESNGNMPRNDCMFLNALNSPRESLVVALGSEHAPPLILRPRLGNGKHRSTTASSRENINDQKHVFGDGHIMVMKSISQDGSDRERVAKVLSSIEMWEISLKSGSWEYVSSVPSEMMEQIKKPHGVMVGCLEARNGAIRAVLMSNFEGAWDIIWLTYEKQSNIWKWMLLPDCKMEGANLAGITFSSGLFLS